MSTDFFFLLDESVKKKNSLLCVGLDPLVKGKSGKDAYDSIIAGNKKIIDETAGYAACFKPNVAFYEKHGLYGLEALCKTLEMIPGDTPLILDAKRGDIGDTAQAYAEAVFGFLNAGAVTVSPYLGKESVEPFLEYEGKAVFVLCRTTNPGSRAIQGLEVAGEAEPCPLYVRIAKEAASWGSSIGLVVAGNDSEALIKIRSLLPGVWFLSPGIGAQGGTVEEAVRAGIRQDKSGMLLNVSRAIALADSPGKSAGEFCARINAAREKSEKPPAAREERRNSALIKGIISEGCFKTGSFVLKSGKLSPFYIDLRRIISNPRLLQGTASCYADILRTLEYRRIAGIPFAGIPIATAVSLTVDKPMIFPRLEKKDHGTGNIIEGAYEPGETVVLLDDLITTGKSKFEALDILISCGLIVRDLVVLVERGTTGRKELSERRVTLHACFNVTDFIDVCRESGEIDDKELSLIRDFLKEG